MGHSINKESLPALLRLCEKSGLSARAWCREQGLAYQSFMRMRREHFSKEEGALIELKREPLELRFKGITLLFSSKEDLRDLKEMLECLC